jgi:integrase
MYKYAKDGISVLTILDTRRKKQSGLYPVKIQVIHNRVQKYYTTGKELTPEDWQRLPESKVRKLIEVREDLGKSFSIIKQNVESLANENGFSFDALNVRLGRSVSDTLNTAFQAKIESLFDSGQIGSYQYYKATLKSIEDFAGTKIQFSSVNVDWLRKYEKHSLTTGNNYTTVGMRCRAIRYMMNAAKKTGIIKENQYPFGNGKYEIPTGQGRKLALTLQQIGKIVAYTDGKETTERYRDLWFFSYLCNGVNFADMLKFKYSNIQNGEIYFLRSKTIRTSKVKRELQAVITPEMQAIIDRWGNKDRNPDSYIFDYLKGNETPLQEKTILLEVIRRCNKRMKKIGEAVGINGISTYTARHSYAIVLKRSGANIAYISESLGHADLKTTENYLASFEREEREKNAKLLTNFAKT